MIKRILQENRYRSGFHRTRYTGSNTETSKRKAVSIVQTLTTKTKPSDVAIVKELELARPKGEAEK